MGWNRILFKENSKSITSLQRNPFFWGWRQNRTAGRSIFRQISYSSRYLCELQGYKLFDHIEENTILTTAGNNIISGWRNTGQAQAWFWNEWPNRHLMYENAAFIFKLAEALQRLLDQIEKYICLLAPLPRVEEWSLLKDVLIRIWYKINKKYQSRWSLL